MIKLGDIYILKPEFANKTNLPLKVFVSKFSEDNPKLFFLRSLELHGESHWTNEEELRVYYIYSHSAQEVLVLRIEHNYYLRNINNLELI